MPAPDGTEKVQFGSTVTIERDDGRRQTWRIVGEDEAEPTQGTLAYASPVARALMGKSVGDVVQAGSGEAEVVEIR
jgi:transcription elongation GreA/GreB family factor